MFPEVIYRQQTGSYDVTPGGQRFIICYQAGRPNPEITLVENWDAELRKK